MKGSSLIDNETHINSFINNNNMRKSNEYETKQRSKMENRAATFIALFWKMKRYFEHSN